VTAQPWPEADPSVLAPVAEHEDLRKVMRDMLQTHASHEQMRRAIETPAGYSRELWSLLNDEMNVSSLAVPEDKGGLGFGVNVLAVVLEESARALLPEPLLSSAVLGVRAVIAAPEGNVPDELRDGLLTGELVATVAVGQHADSVLVASGDGPGATVSGRVGRVVHGTAAQLVVVSARPDEGEGLYLLDLRGPGVTDRRPLEVLDPTRPQARLDLDRAPAYLLAGPDDDARVASELATLGTVALAAEHVGMIDAMLDMTRTYAGQRHQFGRPLASFQVIKHRLADMLVDLERARSAARYAAAVFDQDAASAALPAAVAGATCTDAVIRVAMDTVQLHGGVGFTWEHPAHLYVRRALGDEAVFGPARDHRARIAWLLGL
jgi:alkylation response protein AidB-like acyl-CoA dehydrogenase